MYAFQRVFKENKRAVHKEKQGLGFREEGKEKKTG